MNNKDFKELVYSYYDPSGRGMPWRKDTRPYYVVVSELMLQQTQASRVIPKFENFVDKFPDFQALAAADFKNVLQLWDGLGYNRRARFLHRLAKEVCEKWNGQLPKNREDLESLPGIGPGTSGAIMAYAFNKPAPYIETNIRSIYIHHFFSDQTSIDDKDILEKVEETLDKENPRKWYWALMDYGSYLKSTTTNPSRKSKHHAKQSKFEGSNRQLRAKILKLLLQKPLSMAELGDALQDERVSRTANELLKDGMIYKKGSKLRI